MRVVPSRNCARRQRNRGRWICRLLNCRCWGCRTKGQHNNNKETDAKLRTLLKLSPKPDVPPNLKFPPQNLEDPGTAVLTPQALNSRPRVRRLEWHKTRLLLPKGALRYFRSQRKRITGRSSARTDYWRLCSRYSIALSSTSSSPARIPASVGRTSTIGCKPTRCN
jgi:hypothetical protein